jgi:hypothetical protein
MVPASTFRYGSILMAVGRRFSIFNSTPMEDAVTPFPMPEMTPPVTTMYFFCGCRISSVSRPTLPIVVTERRRC